MTSSEGTPVQGEDPEMEAGETKDKPRWVNFFQRDSHRRYVEHLREREYEDIIQTLRRSSTVEDKQSPSVLLPLPPEQYFLYPELGLRQFGGPLRSSMTSVNSSSMTSSASSSLPTSNTVSSPLECTPEVIEEKKKTRCKRTATLVCLGVLVIALLSLTAGVTLHFLLETEQPMQATEFVDWAKTTNPASRDPGLINDVAPISTTHMFPYQDLTKKSFTAAPASDSDSQTSWVNMSGPTSTSVSMPPTLTSSNILATARSASTNVSTFTNNTKFTALHTTHDPVFSLTNESEATDSPLLSSSSSTAAVIMPTIVTKTKSSSTEAVASLQPSELSPGDSMNSLRTSSADGAQSLNQPASSSTGGADPTSLPIGSFTESTSLMIEPSTESPSLMIESFTDFTSLMIESFTESPSLMIESFTESPSLMIESFTDSTSLMIEPSTESSLGFSEPALQPASASTDSVEPTPLLNSFHRGSLLSSLSLSFTAAVITPMSVTNSTPSTRGAMTLPQPSGLFVDDVATSFYQTASVTTGGVDYTPVPITPSTGDVKSTPSTDSSLQLLIPPITGDAESAARLSTSSIPGAESTPLLTVPTTGGADISSKPPTQSTGGKDSTSLPEITSSSVSAAVWLENSRNLTTAEYLTEGFSSTTLALSGLNMISSSNSLYASNKSVISTESVTVTDSVTATKSVAGSVTPMTSAPVAPAADDPNTGSNATQSSPISDVLSLKNMELGREASMVNSGASSVPGSSNSLLGKNELFDESVSSQRKDAVLDHEHPSSSSKTTSDGSETFLSRNENNATTTASTLTKETVAITFFGLPSSAIKAHPSTGSTSMVTVPSTAGSILSVTTIFLQKTSEYNSSSLSSTTPINKNFNNFEKEPDSSLQTLVSPLADVNPDGNFVQEDNLTAVYNETFTHAPLPVFNATQDKIKSIMSSWTGSNSSFTQTYNETYPRGSKPLLKSESTNITKSDDRFSVFMDLIQDQENITRDFHNFTEMAVNDLVNSLYAKNASTNTTATHSQAPNNIDVGADSTGSHNSYLPIEGLSHGSQETANTPNTNTSAHVEVVTMTPAPAGLIHLAGALNPFIGWSHDKPNRTGDETKDDNKFSTSSLPLLPSRSRNSAITREEDQRNIAGFSKELNPHSSWSGFSSLSGATDINADHRFFTTTERLMTRKSPFFLTVARERSSADPNSTGFVSLRPDRVTGSSFPAQTTTSGDETKHYTRDWSQFLTMAAKTNTETTTSTTVLSPRTITTISDTSNNQPATLPAPLPSPRTVQPTSPASTTSASTGLVLSMFMLRTTTPKVDLPILEEPLLDPLGFPISSDNTHTSDHTGDDGSNLFAFPRRNRNNAHKPATPSTTTTTTKRPTTTTTEKPAEVIIIAPDVTADLGMSPTNSLKVTCHAFQAWGWTYMSLSRFEGTGNATDAVEFLGGVYIFDEFPFIPIDSRMSHHRVHRDTDRVTLTLESQYAVCEDKGTYLCEIIVNGSTWSKTFNVDIRKKPDMPKLKVPGDLISGEEATFVTTWNAGYPLMGTIVHEITKGYTNLPKHATKEQTTTRVMKCEIIVTNSYTVIPDVTWNATEIQVSILPRRDATPKMLQALEVLDKQTVTLSVLRSDVCVGNTNMILPHPYTCTKFINCNDGVVKVQTCPEKTCFHRLQLTCY